MWNKIRGDIRGKKLKKNFSVTKIVSNFGAD